MLTLLPHKGNISTDLCILPSTFKKNYKIKYKNILWNVSEFFFFFAHNKHLYFSITQYKKKLLFLLVCLLLLDCILRVQVLIYASLCLQRLPGKETGYKVNVGWICWISLCTWLITFHNGPVPAKVVPRVESCFPLCILFMLFFLSKRLQNQIYLIVIFQLLFKYNVKNTRQGNALDCLLNSQGWIFVIQRMELLL